MEKKTLDEKNKNIRNEALSANTLLPYLYAVSSLHDSNKQKLAWLLLYSALSTPSPCLGGVTNTLELRLASVCCF